MKEIVVRRTHQNISMMNFKVFVDNHPFLKLRNGESKKIQVDKLLAILYAKLGWLKSRKVIIDETTTE